jgi:hypothetical protein
MTDALIGDGQRGRDGRWMGGVEGHGTKEKG